MKYQALNKKNNNTIYHQEKKFKFVVYRTFLVHFGESPLKQNGDCFALWWILQLPDERDVEEGSKRFGKGHATEYLLLFHVELKLHGPREFPAKKVRTVLFLFFWVTNETAKFLMPKKTQLSDETNIQRDPTPL